MSQIEPNDFEERWRKAFEEASEPPSDKLWDGIERQLLPERPIGLPFFWVGAVLLLLGLGWWWMASRDAVTPSPAITHTAPPVSRPSAGPATDAASGDKAKNTADKTDAAVSGSPSAGSDLGVANPGVATQEAATPGAATRGATTRGAATPAKAPAVKHTVKSVSLENTSASHTGVARSARRLHAQGGPGSFAANRDVMPQPVPTLPETTVADQAIPAVSSIAVATERPVTLDVHAAAGKPWSLLPVNKHLEAPAAALPSLKKKTWRPTFWIGASASLIRFDPHLTLSNDYVSTVNNLYAGFNQSLGSAYVPANGVSRSKAGYDRKGSHISFMAEVTGGYAFSRHWYLESGVSFLRGHSTITDNIVLIDRSSSTRSSIYNQYLMDSKAGSQNYQNSPSTGSGYLSSKNVVVYTSANPFRYTFEYLSVPVSVGYRFRPEKRLDYFVSAGLSADFFIRNTLKDDSDIAIPTAEYYPADGVYKNLSFSGTGAAGVNYRVRPRWSLSLKSFIRKNFTGGIHGDYLQIHPLTIGVGAGIRREF